MNIIGISSHFHDAACALIQDGVLIQAVEEERMSRIKHDKRIPKNAFKYCLENNNLSINDIDCIAYYEIPSVKLNRQISMLSGESQYSKDTFLSLDPDKIFRDIKSILGYEGRVVCYPHHLSHAASSFYFSGFDEAAIFTVDGVGEWETTTYAYGNSLEIDMKESVSFPNSIGLLYSAITAYLGFDVNNGEYKVMGLAPYGTDIYLDKLSQLINIDIDGQYVLNMKYFDFNGFSSMYRRALEELLGMPARQAESEIKQCHKDVAKSLQSLLEIILLKKIDYLHGLAPSTNICLAGGVALNCVANGKLLKQGPYEKLFIQPAAGDSGAALGAAALAHIELTQAPLKKVAYFRPYLGSAYKNDILEKLFAKTPLDLQPLDDPSLLECTAKYLSEGKVIGWFQNKMEFGPRALGNRSILADPRGTKTRDRINALVKKREGFRPFAPAVLWEKCHEHFDIDHESPYMLETCQVISPIDLPAITHVDGSARVQTVTKDNNLLFYNLIDRFEHITGCPILLNTSFNLRGEPVVESPLDALICFIRSDIDVLVLGGYVVERHQLPSEWIDWFHRTTVKNQTNISNDVYSFL